MKSLWLKTGVVALSVTTILAGCGKSNSATGGSKSAASTTLNASFGPVPSAIDPGAVANIDHYVYQPVLGVLLTYPQGQNGQFPPADQGRPELAKSWVKNSDGSYTFTLRDTKSSAGNQLTSQDVLWSFHRMIAVNFISKLVLNVVGGDPSNPITVIDSTHFKLNAKSNNPSLLGALAQFEFGIFDSTATKAHATASDPWAQAWSKTHIVSFGPYVISSFTPGTEIDYTANPNYWNAKNVYIKKIVDRGVTDSSTLLTLLRSGQLDFGNNVPFASMKSIESSTMRVNTQPTPNSLIIAYDLRSAPFNNEKVRQAISLGIDRTAISQGAFAGRATPAKSLVSVAVAGTPSTAATYFTKNDAQAKQLLSEAGYAHGFTFPLYYNAAAGTAAQDAASATLIKQQLSAIGVTVKIMPIASTAQFSAGGAAHTYQASLSEVGPLIPDIGYYAGLEWTSTSLLAPGYDDPALDKVIAKANSSGTSGRSAYLSQILDTVDTELPDISIVDVPNQWAIRSDLTGEYSNGTQGLYPWLLKSS